MTQQLTESATPVVQRPAKLRLVLKGQWEPEQRNKSRMGIDLYCSEYLAARFEEWVDLYAELRSEQLPSYAFVEGGSTQIGRMGRRVVLAKAATDQPFAVAPATLVAN